MNERDRDCKRCSGSRSWERRWRRLVAVLLVGISVTLPAGGPLLLGGDEETDDAASRAEALLKAIQVIDEPASAPSPSVLQGVDLKQAPAEVKKVAKVLRGKRIDLILEKESVEGALEILRDVSGLNFVPSAKASEALKKDDQRLTLTLRGVTLESCIDLIALQLRDYRFAIRYGAVVVMRAEEYKPRKAFKIYDVTDIVRPRPDFPAPSLGLGIPE